MRPNEMNETSQTTSWGVNGSWVRPLSRLCVENEDNAGLAEAGMELPVDDIDAIATSGAALEQDVFEAGGRCAEVGRVEPAGLDAMRVERVRALTPPRESAQGPRSTVSSGVLLDLLARLLVAGTGPP